MARVKGAMMARKRRNKTLKLAKGYWGAKSKHFKMANEQVMKSLTYAYVGRRLKKRDFRQLWITRISAACKLNGMNYSTFMHGLKVAGIQINRKMLSEMAITTPWPSPPCATSPRRRNILYIEIRSGNGPDFFSLSKRALPFLTKEIPLRPARPNGLFAHLDTLSPRKVFFAT